MSNNHNHWINAIHKELFSFLKVASTQKDWNLRNLRREPSAEKKFQIGINKNEKLRNSMKVDEIVFQKTHFDYCLRWRPEPTWVDPLMGHHSKGRLLALSANTRLEWKYPIKYILLPYTQVFTKQNKGW